ncbi:MAG: hypothetical protein GY820_33060 [Gammaproteobacteria bacterium]|nr:hypothetical protein [Gammaproteobacteria bacterium]
MMRCVFEMGNIHNAPEQPGRIQNTLKRVSPRYPTLFQALAAQKKKGIGYGERYNVGAEAFRNGPH